ncbi:MAG: ABC transporter ATP-binding protein [Desulfurococcales archaeon]|nr:ABC transporter ATP-binding protein [Desulfurococcales archaeon]
MEELLRVEGLESGYGEMQVLWGVSLKVQRGSLVVILGPNGAGKTTTLRSIMGIIRPWRGSITFDGEDVTKLPPHKKVPRGLVLVPEGRHLFPDLTVEENLLMGAYTRVGKEDLSDTLELVYSLFPRLKERRSQKAGTMSGGEQQMLAIGRALMAKPKLLMLDEPSQGLAPKIVGDILETLVRLREEQGLTILLVEQNIAQSLKIADYAYVLEQGRVVLEGTSSELLEKEDLVKAYLGI